MTFLTATRDPRVLASSSYAVDMSDGPQLVQLELDEKDKESFTELQQGLGQAQQELGMIGSKLRVRAQEQRSAQLTLLELDEMNDESVAYRQVGKMFLQEPLPRLKASLTEKATAAQREIGVLNEKQTNVQEAAKKLNDDLQEFIKAHLVTAVAGDGK